jgi:hypothetical protein
MTEKRTRTKLKLETKETPKAPITVTDVRQEALEKFAGSLAHVTAIANGVCFVSIKERCTACGQEPDPAPDPAHLLKLVPRPAEITQANALLAKISLPAQTEHPGLAEGQALIEATIGRFLQLAIAHGVPRPTVDAWFAESTQPLKSA